MTRLRLLLFFVPFALIAQQHPLPVEHSTLLRAGNASFAAGVSYFQQQPFPLSGLTGNLLKLGNLRFAISLSDYVELQADGTLLNYLTVERRDSAFNTVRTTRAASTGDIGDFTVWTKFGVFNEYLHGIGFSVRFGIQLPNASNESGLGVDEMNFYSLLLFQKHAGGRWTVNAGLGILSDPTVLGQQHDVFLYGAEYFLPVSDNLSVLLQTAGRVGHEGIGIHRLANGKIGVERDFGKFSASFFGVANFTPSDNAVGAELQLTYYFHVLDIPPSP